VCQQKAMSEGTLSKTRTEACSGDGTRLAGAPCEKTDGTKTSVEPRASGGRTGLNSAACETEAEPRDFLLDRSRRTTETEGDGICTACLRASAGECSEKNQDSVGVPVTEIE
jgi:hypothetical protein